MKQLIGCMIAVSFAYVGTANAIPTVQGYSDDTTISRIGDVWTFIFDEGGSSNEKTAADGLFFQQGSGPRLNVTSNTGSVNQDLGPSDGGLGVTGGDTGDNLSTDEWLNFDFGGQEFDLLAILFNNGPGNVHKDQFLTTDRLGSGCDAANITATGGTPRADCAYDVDQFTDTNWLTNAYEGNFQGITSFQVAEFDSNFQFSGYVEAIRLRIADVPDHADIPEPSIVALMGIGLVGMGFARRRKLRRA